jgi:chaperonin GroES
MELKKEKHMKLEPLGENILISRSKTPDTTEGGIVLPQISKTKEAKGEVIAVGPGRLTENGERVALQVAVGNVVLFTSYAGVEVKNGNDEYLIVKESDILAILK